MGDDSSPLLAGVLLLLNENNLNMKFLNLVLQNFKQITKEI
jgi:hypothetical protein